MVQDQNKVPVKDEKSKGPRRSRNGRRSRVCTARLTGSLMTLGDGFLQLGCLISSR
jgi:hypothetical protein